MVFTQALYSQQAPGVAGGDESTPVAETSQDSDLAATSEGRTPLPREEDLVFAGGDETVGGAASGADGEDIAAFGIWDLVRMVLVLLLVVAAVYGLITILRRRVDTGDSDADSPITILASRNLGGNRDLHVVMVGSRVMLLGGGDGGVQLIQTIEDKETIDELVLAHSVQGSGPRRTFGGVLAQWIGNVAVPGGSDGGRKRQPGAGHAAVGPTATGTASPSAAEGRSPGPFGGAAGFLRTQHDRLRQMR